MAETNKKLGGYGLEEKMAAENIFDLSGRVALVTGGGSGLGRAFCEAMAEYGADVACCDIDIEAAQGTAELINKSGSRVLAIKADVSEPVDVEHMVNEVRRELGKLDILFNNAGITTKPAKTAEIAIEDWDRVMTVNLRGVFLCMRTALPIMVKQKRGSIINISSVAGLKASDPEVRPHAHYNAAKAGVIMLTKQAAIEYAMHGIRVNCIAPGYHRTARGGKWYAALTDRERQEEEELTIRRIPMGRGAEPKEIKGMAVYLASDASSFVTGQVFVQDGGYSI
jgi:NAD(P)-dependent dehydrogenase (short-subunit alcohol dehydrogenase family)